MTIARESWKNIQGMSTPERKMLLTQGKDMDNLKCSLIIGKNSFTILSSLLSKCNFLSFHRFYSIGIGMFFTDSDDIDNMGWIFAKFVFQASFATTATTIVSGETHQSNIGLGHTGTLCLCLILPV